MNEVVENPLGLGSWDGRRQIIYRHLSERAAPLAGLYVSAIHLLEHTSWPARHHLLAHATRELGQRLPDYLNPQPRSRSDDTAVIKDFVKAWTDAALPATPVALATPMTSILGEDGAESTLEDQPFTITVGVAMAAASLVEIRNAGNLNNYRKAASIIIGGQSAGPAGSTRDPTVVLWINTLEWFLEFTHVSDQKDKSLPSEELLRRKFRIIEDVLEAVLGSFYAVIDDLDRYLAAANSTMAQPSNDEPGIATIGELGESDD